ncbi:hypothetical protein EYF80_028829 [Liparis tanakae]|uniref:Uncharacterized protein n=1 Tax=Liparis tanakae TaxID=230148 RepID=A0A4Z2H593_9TELE|nr:hypothetical protein EYF80_028829 [Liparis tanakae]
MQELHNTALTPNDGAHRQRQAKVAASSGHSPSTATSDFATAGDWGGQPEDIGGASKCHRLPAKVSQGTTRTPTANDSHQLLGDVIEGNDSAAVSPFGQTDGLYFSPGWPPDAHRQHPLGSL